MIEIVSHKPPQGLIDGALVVDEDSWRLNCWRGEPGGSLRVVTQKLAGVLASPPTVIPPGIRLKYFHWLNAPDKEQSRNPQQKILSKLCRQFQNRI